MPELIQFTVTLNSAVIQKEGKKKAGSEVRG